MMRLGRVSGRKWVVVGAALGLIGALGAILGWTSRDPWPIRVVIGSPRDGDSRTQRLVPQRPQGFTPDGRSFLTSNLLELKSWDAATGKPQKVSSDLVVWRKSYASDGKSFVGMTGSDFAESEVVWVDAGSGAIKAKFPVKSRQVLGPRLINEGRSIRAILGDRNQFKEVVTWDLASGAEARRPILGPGGQGISRNMPPICSPDGRIYPYFDPVGGGVRLWDVEADRPVGGLLQPHASGLDPTPGVVFTPDGRTLILGQSDGKAELWDVAGSRLIKVVKVHSNGFRFRFDEMEVSPNGRTLASAGQHSGPSLSLLWLRAFVSQLLFGSGRLMTVEVVVTDLASGQTLTRSPGSTEPLFSPDGRTIVTREWDGTFSVRDAPRPASR